MSLPSLKETTLVEIIMISTPVSQVPLLLHDYMKGLHIIEEISLDFC